jgi:glutathione S-transferase
MRAPGLIAATNGPLARAFAAAIGADDKRVRRDVQELPEQLEHVDALIAGGIIGTDKPNAADYQIGTTVRVLMSFADLRPMIERRPAGELALKLVSRWPDEVPSFLPAEWLSLSR